MGFKDLGYTMFRKSCTAFLLRTSDSDSGFTASDIDAFWARGHGNTHGLRGLESSWA